MKKFIALIIIIIVILTACQNGSDNDKTSETKNNSDETQGINETEILPVLPEDADYEGYEFRVVTRGDERHNYPLHTRDIYADEQNGESINDAVYLRNRTVEDLFNVQIVMYALNEDDSLAPNTAVERAVLADEDLYDLLMTHEIFAAPTAQNGYLMNLAYVSYIDLSKPWWDKSATNDLSVGNKIFLALSDFSVSSNDHAIIFLFNKELHTDYELENFYELVSTNKWTFDKMHEIIKYVKADLNGDGQMTEEDLYGFISGDLAMGFYYSGGNTLTKKDADNIPYYDILNERSILTYEKTLAINSDDHTYAFIAGWEDKKIIPMFANGNGLLLMTQIGIIQQLRNMEIDFGLLPVPKLNEQQEKYLLNIDGHAQLMAIPITVRETEKVGAILEALSYYSHKYLVPAYYDVNLKTKFSRDNESSEMLDIIMDGRIFDFGYVYDNWVIAFQFQYLIREKAINYVSKIESLLPTAEAQLKKILDAYDAIE